MKESYTWTKFFSDIPTVAKLQDVMRTNRIPLCEYLAIAALNTNKLVSELDISYYYQWKTYDTIVETQMALDESGLIYEMVYENVRRKGGVTYIGEIELATAIVHDVMMSKSYSEVIQKREIKKVEDDSVDDLIKEIRKALKKCEDGGLYPTGFSKYVNVINFMPKLLLCPDLAKQLSHVLYESAELPGNNLEQLIYEFICAKKAVRGDKVERIIGDQSEYFVIISIDNLNHQMLHQICKILRKSTKLRIRVILIGDVMKHPGIAGAQLIFKKTGFLHSISDYNYFADAFIPASKGMRPYMIGRLVGMSHESVVYGLPDSGFDIKCPSTMDELFQIINTDTDEHK